MGDLEWHVIGAEMAGDRRGLGRLVEGAVGEADGEGPDRTVAVSLHEGDHQARVDAAGEERADRYVRDHACGDRLGEDRLELVGHLLGGAVDRFGARLLDGLPCRPVGPERERAPRGGRPVGGRELAGEQLRDPAVDRVRRRHAVVPEVKGDGVAVDLRAEPGECAQRLELGGEREPASDPAVVEGLLPEPVPDQVELALAAVPECDGEHALDRLERAIDAPLLDGPEEHLGVRPAAEGDALAGEPVSEGAVVVDLAVVVDDPPAVGGHHGLRAVRAEPHHRQPAVPEAQPALGVGPGALRIGSPVDEGRGHRGDLPTELLGPGRPGRVEQACNPAHALSSASVGFARGVGGARPPDPSIDHASIIGPTPRGVKRPVAGPVG